MLSSAGIPEAEYASQAIPVKYCHWVCVVLFQFVRELVYMILGLIYKIRRVCKGRKSPIAKDSLLATKKVYFVRHGQGNHNASIKGWQLVDPPLNAKGEEQVQALAAEMKPKLAEFDLIVTSPLTRAMQTATGGFAGCKAPFMVNALLRERMGAPCDTGRTKSELLKAFPKMSRWLGIDELPEVWWSTSAFEWDLLARVEELEDWISARPEKTIAIVGHGGLFSRFVGYHLHNCEALPVNWVSPTSSSAEMV